MTTWTEQDLPVLTWLVSHFEPIDALDTGVDDLVDDLVDLPQPRIEAALRNLYEDEFITGIPVAQLPYPVRVTGVTAKARRAVGQWPSPEGMVDALVRELNARAAATNDPEEKGRLQRMAEQVSGVAREIFIGVMTAQIGGAG